MINVNIIKEITNKKLPFPDTIRQLSELGIERYYTDLVKMDKTYYSNNTESCVETMAIDNLPTLGKMFDQEKIITAIQQSQQGKIDYHTFLRNIIAAGCASYTVYLNGNKVIYFGRNGECHTENFHFAM